MMAPEITAGSWVLVLGLAGRTLFDAFSDVSTIEVRVPDEQGELCLVNPVLAVSLDALREVLEKCEWAAETTTGVPQCPVCYHAEEVVHLPDETGAIAREPGYHAGDCELGTLLSQIREAR